MEFSIFRCSPINTGISQKLKPKLCSNPSELMPTFYFSSSPSAALLAAIHSSEASHSSAVLGAFYCFSVFSPRFPQNFCTCNLSFSAMRGGRYHLLATALGIGGHPSH
jgi:hypothetical protein